MDDLVICIQDLVARPRHGFQHGEEGFIVGPYPARHRRDRMMKVDFEGMSGDTHRRQLVAPLTIVVFVVGNR